MSSIQSFGLYKPLNEDTNEIRLLTIEDVASPSTLLHCHLAVHSLDDLSRTYRAHLADEEGSSQLRRKDALRWSAKVGEGSGSGAQVSDDACRFGWGDYDALSYHWGTKMSRRPIRVNGQDVPVTENLITALEHMAKTGRYGGRRKLWVDALCINQTDEHEQASQISKMRQIYGMAWNVIAWLGEERDASNAAFEVLERFAEMAHDSDQRPFGELAIPSMMFFQDYFYGLNELMQRPYWSRLWIVQELVLGSSSVLLHCGGRTMNWSTFCSGLNVLFRADMWIIKDQLLRYEHEMHELGGPNYRAIWTTLWLHLVHKDIQTLARYEVEGGGSLGLRRLLDIASGSDCRDVRDKVFALVGMMEPEIANTLTQDYSGEPSTLFATVVRSFITYYNNLEPLREGNPWSKTNTPSWAADWTWEGRIRYSRPETPLWGFWTLSNEPPINPHSLYNAAGDQEAHYTFIGDRVLKCRGFVVDVVAGLGAVGFGYFRWEACEVKQYRSWESAYGGRQETAVALYRTLLLDRMAAGGPVEPRHAAILNLPKTFSLAKPQFHERQWPWMKSQEGYYFRWELWRAAHDGMMLGDAQVGEFFSDVLLEGATEEDYAEVYGAFDRTSKERRFMLTRNGCMGWAPDNIVDGPSQQAMVDDLVCVIFGCSTPLIIRPTGTGYFKVVGEAYVHGMMDGQALDLLETNRCQIQEFTFV